MDMKVLAVSGSFAIGGILGFAAYRDYKSNKKTDAITKIAFGVLCVAVGVALWKQAAPDHCKKQFMEEVLNNWTGFSWNPIEERVIGEGRVKVAPGEGSMNAFFHALKESKEGMSCENFLPEKFTPSIGRTEWYEGLQKEDLSRARHWGWVPMVNPFLSLKVQGPDTKTSLLHIIQKIDHVPDSVIVRGDICDQIPNICKGYANRGTQLFSDLIQLIRTGTAILDGRVYSVEGDA